MARSSGASSRAARAKSAEAGRGATEPAERLRTRGRGARADNPLHSTRSSGCHARMRLASKAPSPGPSVSQRRRCSPPDERRARLFGRASVPRQPSRVTVEFTHPAIRRTRAILPAAISSGAAPTPCASPSSRPRSCRASGPATRGRAHGPASSSRSATPSRHHSPTAYSRLRYGPAKATGSVETPGDPRADQRRGDRGCARDTIHQAGRRQPYARVC